MLYGQAFPASPAAPKPTGFIDDLLQDPAFIAKLQQEQGGSPMAAPMAPQAPMAGPNLQLNPDGTAPAMPGIEQAMLDDSFESKAISEMPAAPPEKKLGLFGRINAKPGGSRALLTLGANLLSSPDFFSGLGKGALAFQNVIDEETEKQKPKVEYLANGAFQLTTDPVTGERRIERTPVADYEQTNLTNRLETQEKVGRYRADASVNIATGNNATRLETTRMQLEADEAAAAKAQDWDATKFYAEQATKLKIAEIQQSSTASGGKPSAGVLRDYDAQRKRSLTLSQTNTEIAKTLNRIETGELPLNFLKGLEYRGRAIIGAGSSESTNYQELVALMNKMTLAITQSSVGVQTNFDYEKAQLQGALSNNDAKGVTQALQRMRQIFIEEKALADEMATEYENSFNIGGSQAAPAPQKRATQSIREKYGLE
jgi:hypothetical protein